MPCNSTSNFPSDCEESTRQSIQHTATDMTPYQVDLETSISISNGILSPHTVFAIDPLASLAVGENFLWPKIQHNEPVSYPVMTFGKNSESVVPSTTTPVASSTQTVRSDGNKRRMRCTSRVSAAG